MRFSLLSLLFIVVLSATLLQAQTNPTPFDLSQSNYSFTQWDATNPAGTYPPNMRIHMYSTSSGITTIEPLVLNYEMNSDWDLAYNLTSGARILGSGVDGISFNNTSSSSYSPPRFFGAAVLAISTSNRVNVRVNWTGGTVATQPRQYAIVLQYRVGTTDPWQTAILNGTDTVQYKVNTVSGHSAVQPTFTLPAACENQPVVQLRWRYYQFSTAASGNRPQLRVDDISVLSDASTGVPVKLAVVGVSPATPSVLTPFSVTVQTVNASDQIRSVVNNTNVSLSLYSGTGTLAGTLTGTIAAGTNTVTFSGLTYSQPDLAVQVQVARTSGDVLSSAIGAPFTVLPRATTIGLSSVQTYGFVGVPLSTITATAKRPDNSTDLNYPGPLTLAKVSGPGTVAGTLTQNPVAGVVNFSDITFSAAGTYVLSVSGPNIATVQTSSIVIVAQPNVVELLMPQYMAARSITLPSWALVRLDGLQPNTAYRFFTSAADINNLVGFAAGTNLHYNVNASTFSYVPSSFSDFNTPGRYSEFATGSAETSKVLWINMVPSSNSRFTAGNNMYWYITLRDTNRAIETRFVTTGTTKAINISTAAGDATGISDTASTCDPKTVICLYDNVNGTGGPLATALVQDDGTVVSGAPAFYAAIESQRTAWATLIPNTLASGVRRVEQRSLQTGAIIKVWVDDDGVWSPVSTVNARGGNNAIIFPTPQVQFPTSLTGKSFCTTQAAVITWTSRGVAKVDLQISSDGVNFTTFAAGITASAGTYTWNIPTNFAGGNNLRLRIVDSDRPDVLDQTGFVNVNAPAVITVDPISQDACVGGTVTLITQANGTSLKYQWEKDGYLLVGQTSPVLTITNVSNGTSGLYRCLVSSGPGCSGTSSKYAVISTLPDLSVVTQPRSIAVAIGGLATLSVEASVQSGVQYQWFRGTTALSDNAHISGSRSASLTIRNVNSSDFSNDYNCKVTSICGSVFSKTAGISSASITVLTQPENAVVCAGSDQSFSTGASTSTPSTINYQWMRNGVALTDDVHINGAKTQILTIKTATILDTGRYSCKITTSLGAVAFTNTVTLDISTAPSIRSQTVTLRKCAGDTTEFNVGVLDTNGIHYQWQYLGQNIAGATGKYLRVTASESTAGSYNCIVTNACGADTAKLPKLELIQATTIITQPRKETKLLEGGTIILNIEAKASSVHYQWFHNGKAIEGDTLANLSVLKAQVAAAGDYTCLVTGDCGAVMSDTARVLITSDIEELTNLGLRLMPASPNPTSSTVQCGFELRSASAVQLQLCDFLGRPVATIADAQFEAGKHSMSLNVLDIPTGTYFIVMRCQNALLMQRVAVVH